MTCTICGDAAAAEHHLTRGLIVFCCSDCAPLIEDVHTTYGREHAPAG